MSGLCTTVLQKAKQLLSDDRGAEGLEKLLIIGAIVLPLLGILFFFRDQITDLLTSRWQDIEGDLDPDPFMP